MVVTAQLSSEPVSDITLSMTFTAGLLASILEEPGLAGGHPWPARAVLSDWQHHVKILPLAARLPVCLGGLLPPQG